jgi:hypothetical protein
MIIAQPGPLRLAQNGSFATGFFAPSQSKTLFAAVLNYWSKCIFAAGGTNGAGHEQIADSGTS